MQPDKEKRKERLVHRNSEVSSTVGWCFLHPNAHVRIARKVAMDLGKVDLSRTLEYYSVLPDKWRDFPHHTGGRRPRRIVQRVFRARDNYIHDNDNKAAAELGLAFHYIADEHVLVRGSDRRHVSYESKINRAPLNIQHMDSMEGKKATLGYIVTKISELSNRRYILTPEDALNSSYKICASIAKSVFGSKTSLELQIILMELRRGHIGKMKETEEEFVNELFDMAKKDEEIENSKGMRKVANKIIKTLSFFDFRFRRNIKKYKERKHLENSVKSYYRKAALASEPYKDWYLVETPELSIWTEEVKPKLLTLESIMKTFNLNRQRINELEEKAKILTISLKDAVFVKREDVPEIAAYLNVPNPLAEPPDAELRQLSRKASLTIPAVRLVSGQAVFNETVAKKLFGGSEWVPTNIPLSELKSVMPSGIVSDKAEKVGISHALNNLFEDEMVAKFTVVSQRLLSLAEEGRSKYLATVDLQTKVFACNCPVYDGKLPCKHVLLTIYHYHDILLKLYASHEVDVWREALVKAQQHAHSQAMLCNWLYYFVKGFVSHLNLRAGRYEDLKAVERLVVFLGDGCRLGASKMFYFKSHTINDVVADSVPPREA